MQTSGFELPTFSFLKISEKPPHRRRHVRAGRPKSHPGGVQISWVVGLSWCVVGCCGVVVPLSLPWLSLGSAGMGSIRVDLGCGGMGSTSMDLGCGGSGAH